MKKTVGIMVTAIASIAIYETLKRYGVLDKVQGIMEREFGKASNDPALQAKGMYHSTKGEVKETFQNIGDSVKDTIEDIKD